MNPSANNTLAEYDSLGREYDTLAYDKLHQLRRTRGYAKQDSEATLKTQSSTMDTLERKRARDSPVEGSRGAGSKHVSRSSSWLFFYA